MVRTTNKRRWGSPPRGAIVPSSPLLQLQRRGHPRDEPDAEARPRGFAHRGVGAEREDRRHETVAAQPLLRHRARAGAGLAQQPRARGQLRGRDPAPLRERVVARGDQHDLVDRERLAGQPLVVGHAAGDRHVGLMVEQLREDLGAVADVQADLELGMRVAEGPDQLRDEVVAGGGDRGDAQRRATLIGRLERGAAALAEQPEHVRRVRRVRRAGGGRAQATAVALEQLGADLALERRERGRHRRLRHHQLLRGRRHRPAPHDADERGELGQRDGHGASSARAAAPSPRARGGFQSAPTVREPSTHEPSSGCANFVCCSLSMMP